MDAAPDEHNDKAKVSQLIETLDLLTELTRTVEKLEQKVALMELAQTAQNVALQSVNDRILALHQRVRDLEFS